MLELSQLMQTGETSSTEVVSLLINQIHSTDSRVKAYVTVCEKSAQRLAATADKEIRAGNNKGILQGIPISIKDNFETKGIRTTCSSKILEDYIPKIDATVVTRLKSAGAIILGKLNTHEFAQGGLTPPTRNPWNLRHIAGGSSGGSGAAVSASSALAATGSDTGGSIRMPAAVCGVVGLKPTYGRVSRRGVFPASWSLDHIGPITRRVEDAALLLMIMAGKDRLDSTSSDLAVPNYVGAIKKGLKGCRIGVPKNHFFEVSNKRISKAIYRAIGVLESLGCTTDEMLFPDAPKIMAARLAIDMCESAAYHAHWLSTSASKYQPDVRLYLQQGMMIPAVYYIQALRYRAKVFDKIQPLFKRFDVMITPTELMLAPRAGEKVMDDLIMHCTGPFNLLGFPALSVPCGFADGLPIGMQIVGRMFDEATVLRVGHAYERESKLYLRSPSIP